MMELVLCTSNDDGDKTQTRSSYRCCADLGETQHFAQKRLKDRRKIAAWEAEESGEALPVIEGWQLQPRGKAVLRI